MARGGPVVVFGSLAIFLLVTGVLVALVQAVRATSRRSRRVCSGLGFADWVASKRRQRARVARARAEAGARWEVVIDDIPVDSTRVAIERAAMVGGDREVFGFFEIGVVRNGIGQSDQLAQLRGLASAEAIERNTFLSGMS